MHSLNELSIKYNSDKGVYHGYTDLYEKHFNEYRLCDIKLIEFGVWNGSSIKMWLEYFRNDDVRIYGVDIGECDISDGRYRFIKGRQESDDVADKFEDNFFDIIIDDGGHLMSQQQDTFKNFWNKLKCGGLYIIEDLHTSFVIDYIDRTPTTYDLLKFKTKSNDMELNKVLEKIENIEFYHRDNSYNFYSSIACIIRK